MSESIDSAAGLVEPGLSPERLLGRIRGAAPGPTMIVMTGIHGNEPAGGAAALRVLHAIDARGIAVRGEIVVLAGNLPALGAGLRFVDEDLNRQWTPIRLAAIRARAPEDDTAVEDGQRRELDETLARIVEEARGPVYFLDLHTSSADGPPFLTVGDTLRNREFALRLPLPILLGLEEQVDGSLLEYLNNFGFVTIGVEAGRHDCPRSIDRHEALLWLAAVAAGLIDRAAAGDLHAPTAMLRAASRDIPRVLEVRLRHPVAPDDGFRMEPGWTNFDRVRRGQLLARDRRGPIHASEDGRIMLPLYQARGDDGFFLGREFNRFWLTVSKLLRRLYVSGWVRRLPGVRLHPDAREGEVLVVSTRIARLYPMQVFHLLGYRKLRRIGGALVVSRRRHDTRAPVRPEMPA